MSIHSYATPIFVFCEEGKMGGGLEMKLIGIAMVYNNQFLPVSFYSYFNILTAVY